MATYLNDAGATVDPIQVMEKIICTHPRTFQSFLSAWDNVPASKKTMKLLTSRQQREERNDSRGTP